MAEEAPNPREHRFELVETVVLAAAAVLTAWAAFQSTKWGGVQADSYSRANATRVESAAVANEAGQHRIVDTEMFTSWVAAVAAETRAGRPPSLSPEGVYQPDPATESGFLFDRFRDEFKPIVTDWLSTHPLTDPDAPPTPFDLREYQSREDARVSRLDQEADDLSATARKANQNGDNYVLMTILFATALVLVGLGSKMHAQLSRLLLLGLSVCVLLVSTGVVLWFPKEI